MTEYVTVSAKIPRELRERARELGISPSEVIKRALEEEVKRREVEELTKRLKEAERLGVDVKRIVERALEEEIRRAKMERFKRLVEEAFESMDVSVDEWVRAVKESRMER